MDRNDPKQEAATEIAESTLQDLFAEPLVNAFDPGYWLSVERPRRDSDPSDFVSGVFLILTRYWHGEEITRLTDGFQWLADLTVPSKRHISAQLFQKEPARNLAILTYYVKLQAAKIYGCGLMSTDPFWCLCYELINIRNREKPDRTIRDGIARQLLDLGRSFANHRPLDPMTEFGDTWTKFLE